MSTAAKNFNVDLIFLYGTTEIYDASASMYVPNWSGAYTDWNRRTVDGQLPVVTKEVENWSGKFTIGEARFTLADTDGSVTGSLYGTGYPHGNKVAIYEKVSENPTQWMNVYTGLVSSTERESGLFTVACEDSLRNVLNAQFIPDFRCISTFADNAWYGVVKDVIGSNIYVNDKYSKQLIKIKQPEEDAWGGFFGAIVGGALGFLRGGPVGAAVGAGAGLLSGLPSNSGAKNQYYWRITDYNLIPDGVIFGGQPLKFYSGSVDGRANGNSGLLYSVPSQKIKGGTFAYGGEGTIEIDDILNTVKQRDFIYTQMPLIYRGSPDTIIVDILTGSNISASYVYPNDFSDQWFEQTETLRHIDSWAVVDNFETGGVVDTIDSICKEFGFSLYLDEENKFAVRGNRLRSIGTGIIGTLDERYNVLNRGFSRKDDIKTSYTDITINFKDSVIGNVFEQSIMATMPSATYFGALRRNLTINSKWMHDRITAEFIATRLARKFNGIVPKINAEISLYGVPFTLSDLVSCTGWAVGTGEPYEITKYTKDYSRSIAQIEAESGSYYYKVGYFKVGTLGTKSTTSSSGFATIISPALGYDYGSNTYKINSADTTLWFDIGVLNHAAIGDYIRFTGYEETMRVIYAGFNLGGSPTGGNAFEYHVERGRFNTTGQIVPAGVTMSKYDATTVPPVATLLSGNTSAGTSYRWF